MTTYKTTNRQIVTTILTLGIPLIFIAIVTLTLTTVPDTKDYLVSVDMQSYMETVGSGEDFSEEDMQ